MKDLNEEDIKERLVFLLEKVELSPEEMRWLLNYLEHSEEQELREILYKHFLQNPASSEYLPDTNGAYVLKRMREQLYKQLFG